MMWTLSINNLEDPELKERDRDFIQKSKNIHFNVVEAAALSKGSSSRHFLVIKSFHLWGDHVVQSFTILWRGRPLLDNCCYNNTHTVDKIQCVVHVPSVYSDG